MSEIDIRVRRACSQLRMKHPFFGVLVMRLIIVERSDIQTMATDGKFLFYCRAFLDRTSEYDLLFTCAHEVLHCALSHMTRRVNRRWDLWQAATDYVVNLMLQEAGFTVPKWVKYFDERFKGLGVERVYSILESEEQQQQQQDEEDQPQPQPQAGGQGSQQTEDEDATADRDSDDGAPGQDDEHTDGQEDAGDGDQQGDDQCATNTAAQDAATQPGNGEDEAGASGTPQSESAQDGNTGASSSQKAADGEPSESSDGPGTPSTTSYAPAHGDPGGCGEVLDAAPPYDKAANEEMADEWKVYTRQAANIARRQGEGKLPGFFEEIIEVLDTPKHDWRETLHRFVSPSQTKDYAWTNPSRRMMSLGYFVPGMISDGINHVVFITDSSASIDIEWLRQSGSEVQDALDNGAIDKVSVVFVDEKVQRTAEYTHGETIDFTAPGRGGTKFSPGFEWVNDNAPDTAAVIYLTDLDCSDFGPPPSYPVLWVVYGDPKLIQARMDRVPFGECVELRN